MSDKKYLNQMEKDQLDANTQHNEKKILMMRKI
jgi:hypothetical protein